MILNQSVFVSKNNQFYLTFVNIRIHQGFNKTINVAVNLVNLSVNLGIIENVE